VEFIQKCIVFDVSHTPGTFKPPHARKCCDFSIFFVGSMTAKKVIHTTHSPLFITPVCTLALCLDRGSIFRFAAFIQLLNKTSTPYNAKNNKIEARLSLDGQEYK
jgi:hypothetical protein